MERMKPSIGVAVSTMEGHIKAGTMWCPLSSAKGSALKTPKTRKSIASNNKISGASESESTTSVVIKLDFSTYEKKGKALLKELAIEGRQKMVQS